MTEAQIGEWITRARIRFREVADGTLHSGRANQPITCREMECLLWAFSAAWLEALAEVLRAVGPAADAERGGPERQQADSRRE